MARRGILDYVLGGAVGGLEGLAQQRAAEDEKKRLNEALARQQGMDAMDRARFLRESGYRVAPPAYDTEDPAARSILPSLEMPSAAPSSGTRAGGALSAALNRGMGVDTTQPSLSRPSFGAAPLAMDSGGSRMTEMFERAQETRPAQEAIAASVKTPLGNLRFLAPESEDAKQERELRKYEAQQGVITARQKAEQDRANRGFFAILSRAKAIPEGVTYEEVQDIDLKPFFQEYTQGRSAEAAFSRAQLAANTQAGMVNIVEGIDPNTGRPALIQAPRGGGSLRLTGFDAPGKSLSPAAQKVVDMSKNISQDDLDFVRSYMPTPKTDASGKVIGYAAPTRRLKRGEALVGGIASATKGAAGEIIYSATSPEAQRLNNIIESLADRKALDEQGGRLSDNDIIIKRREVAVRSGDVNNDPLLYRKLSTVLDWAKPPEQASSQQPVKPQGLTKAQFFNQWKATNSKKDDESPESYAQKATAAWAAFQGGR